MASTIYDVAKKANVSISTVSRVLNNRDRINQQTKERVRKAIAELDFIPNVNASGLAKSKTGIIGVLIYGFDDVGVPESYTIEFLSGIQQRLKTEETSLLIINSLEECERLTKNKRMDGLIIHGFHDVCEGQHFEWITDLPVVYTGEKFSDQQLDVYYRFEHYLKAGIEKLVEQSHSQICSVFYADNACELTSKIGIFQKVYQQFDLEFSIETSLVNGAFDKDNVYLYIAERIKSGATACLTDSVYFAQQVIDSTTLLGIKIPDQLSVVSMEYEQDAAGWLHPPISSLNIPSYELGKSSTDMLLERIEKSEAKSEPKEFMPTYNDHGSISKITV